MPRSARRRPTGTTPAARTRLPLEFIEPEVVDFYAATFDAEDLEVIEDTGDYEINFTDYLARAKS
jgi:hypothetical protein